MKMMLNGGFERMRDKAHPSSQSRYNNMINNLKDTESVYYNTVKFGDLANEDSLIMYPNPVRSTERRIWKIDIDKHTSPAEYIVKLAELDIILKQVNVLIIKA